MIYLATVKERKKGQEAYQTKHEGRNNVKYICSHNKWGWVILFFPYTSVRGGGGGMGHLFCNTFNNKDEIIIIINKKVKDCMAQVQT